MSTRRQAHETAVSACDSLRDSLAAAKRLNRGTSHAGTLSMAAYALGLVAEALACEVAEMVATAEAMEAAGIVRIGTHCDSPDGDSWTSYAVIRHNGRTDAELSEALETAGYWFGDITPTPSPYDCTGRTHGYGGTWKRGRKVAVITARRFLDV